ncbi:MAG: cysteine desulfurase [Cyanobacteria bacterium K_DeepCast_35m_m2_023]|nr:cysteine desulfurase [Cyanobacteria bacterium K_DeepCast_35m_m2_023]
MLAYLDHHATTPCDPAVVAAMAPWWSEHYANPASRQYRPGLEAAAAVELAAAVVRRSLGASAATEVVFCSGATEANNLALKGLAEAALAAGSARRRFVSVVSEHHAVLDVLRYLERLGFGLTLLPLTDQGLVDPTAVAAALDPAAGGPVLALSVMAANNEIGAIAPLAHLAPLARAAGALLHVDAAQAAGHIALDMDALAIDLLSLSAHKFYGPKGIGALLIGPGPAAAGLLPAPQLHGGGQQGGLRAGTLPVPLVVGLAKALELAIADREARGQRLGALRDHLWAGLQALGPFALNGPPPGARRLPHNLNVTAMGANGGLLHQQLRRQIAISSGSACSLGSPSHVLAALGRTRLEAAATLRFGLGRSTTAATIEQALEVVATALAHAT